MNENVDFDCMNAVFLAGTVDCGVHIDNEDTFSFLLQMQDYQHYPSNKLHPAWYVG